MMTAAFAMRNLTVTICLTIAVLLGSAGVSWSADFQKGVTAYESGDYATALREWTPLAEQGNAAAQTLLGFMYDKGQGVPQDYKTAVKWWRLAAEQGDAGAQNHLGVMYNKGRGVPQDDKTAVKWYTLAAEQGNVYAQNGLALALLHGRGTEKNPKEALRLLKSAVRNGLKGGYSETTIGWSYFTGKHAPAIPKNFAKSLYWNHLGSRAGHANAHSNLALHYFGGFGVEQNFSKMVYHLIKSAEFFDENLKWVTEEPDEWLDYRHMASSHFWNARVLYWKAISTGKRSYIYDLKKMNPEHEAERREQNRIA